ncbi:hypothetical protein ACET3Z_010608 [Daucus carota]
MSSVYYSLSLSASPLLSPFYLTDFDGCVKEGRIRRGGLIPRRGSRRASRGGVTLGKELGPLTSVKWAPDGCHIVVGMNSSKVQLWNSSANQQDQFAAKVIERMPQLPSMCIRFWNTNTGAWLNTVHPSSQVYSLMWNKNEREPLNSHVLPRINLLFGSTHVFDLFRFMGRAL